MQLFEERIIQPLNDECNGDPIHFVGLGSADFQLSFGNLERIQNEEQVEFCFSGANYTWKHEPTDAPVWLLIGQVPTNFQLLSNTTLRMWLASGDYVGFFTAEHKYESTVIHFGQREGINLTEVF